MEEAIETAMAQSPTEMRIERILEPRLTFNTDNKYIALIGASVVNYRTMTATSTSQAGLSWSNMDPPDSARSVIGRKIYITVHVTMQFTADAG